MYVLDARTLVSARGRVSFDSNAGMPWFFFLLFFPNGADSAIISLARRTNLAKLRDGRIYNGTRLGMRVLMILSPQQIY